MYIFHVDREYNCSSLKVVFFVVRNYGYYFMNYYVPSILLVSVSWVTFWEAPDAVPGRTLLGENYSSTPCNPHFLLVHSSNNFKIPPQNCKTFPQSFYDLFQDQNKFIFHPPRKKRGIHFLPPFEKRSFPVHK